MPMLIQDVMTKPVIRIHANDNLSQLVKIMAERKISTVIVGNGEGIITERDMVRRVLLPDLDVSSTLVKDIMTKKLITVKPGDDIKHGMNMLEKNNIRHLVVEDDNKIVGVITQTDLLRTAMDTHNSNATYTKYLKLQTIVIAVLAVLTISLFFLRI